MIEKIPVFNNRKNKSVIVDGKEIWIHRSVACVGMVFARYNDEWYVLFSKRGTGAADHQGYWNVPCGYLDFDETLNECIIREVFEESGFFIPDIKPNFIYESRTNMKQPYFVQDATDSNRQNISNYFSFVFDAQYYLPELTTKYAEPNEVEITKWVKLSELGGYSKVAFNHMERIHEFIKKFNIK